MLAGCDPQPESVAHTVRDSVGIRIVESTAPRWRDGTEWTVDSTVTLVGGTSDAPGQQLDDARAAVRLTDGTLVVANSGSRQLLRYDSRGTFLGAAGRAGEGPGEFQALSWVGRIAGDSLVTWDRGLNRISIFSPTGEYVRMYRPELTEAPMAMEVKGMLSGGRVVLARGASFIPRDGAIGIQRQPITAWSVEPTGAASSVAFGPFPGEAVSIEPAATRGGIIRTPVPFGASTLFAAGGDAVLVVDTDAFAVRRFASDGRLEWIARHPWTPRRVTAEDVKAHIDQRMEGLPNVQSIRDGVRASLEKVKPAELIPAVAAVHADADGNVWVKTGHPPADTVAMWSIFDRQGVWLGDLRLASATGIFEIGASYLVVLERDTLDVERVRVVRLGKGPR